MTEATLERADVRDAEPTVEAILDSTWFQPEQFKTLDYVKGFVGAKVIFQMLQLGVFDDLLAGKSLAQIAEGRKMDAYLLRTVFEYLAVEGLLVKEGEGAIRRRASACPTTARASSTTRAGSTS